MKLFYTPTSPFARKVRVAAHELALHDRVQYTLLRPDPMSADPVLSAVNPLNKIPAMVLESGEALYDSPVICEFLDTLSEARPMTPRSGPERFRVLRTQALCDGILDAGILVFYERTKRPSELHWQPWLRGQVEKASQGLDELERRVGEFGSEVDLAQICAGITLGWLEFRDAVGDIRAGRPRLFEWYESFARRPSMVDTAPYA